MAYYHSNAPKKGYNFCQEESMVSVLDRFEIGQRITKPGRITNRIFKAAESSYCVFEVEDNQHHRFIISGQFPVQPQIDGYYEFTGIIRNHKHGRQLAVENYHSALPETSTGIITLLTTLPGLDTRAAKLYELFGRDVLKVVKTDPERISHAVKGISLARARLWQRQLLDQEKTEDGMQQLLGFGLSPKQAGTLLEKHGGMIVDKIKDDPYFLMKELPRFSFMKCDSIALKNGAHIDDTTRLVQAMLYTLRKESTNHGHCYLPKQEFIDKSLRVINMTLDYRTAQQIMKREGDVVRINIGGNKAILRKESIQTALDEWEAGSRRKPFYFPIFDVPRHLVEEAIGLSGGTIHVHEEAGESRVYPTRLFYSERLIARTVRIMTQNQIGQYEDKEAVIQSICKKEKITLEDRQLQAVRDICDGPGGIYILTGSAGCGKTFTLNVIIKVLRKLQAELYRRPLDAKILAPTGKAAKVASQATGLPASTIHMALGINELGQFTKTIAGDVIVIDEFSMVDTFLAAELFAAISPMAKVIILGDTKQLPSVGPGLVLHDLIASNAVPVIELNVVKRQGEGSGILENAQRIVNGDPICTISHENDKLDGDAYVIEEGNPILCQEKVLQTVERLLKTYPIEDIQVLCPQHKGETGTDVLNLRLQQLLNPHTTRDAFLNRVIKVQGKEVDLCFQPGDKVIHIKNNYKMQWQVLQGDVLLPDLGHVGIINGETGIIHSTRIEGGHKVIVVKYDGGYMKYEDDFSELDHAYALTIHKSQGSQWPVVVCPILDSNYIMLTRNLFYTMYTRAQNVSVVIGSRRAMDHAVENDAPENRNSGLLLCMAS